MRELLAQYGHLLLSVLGGSVGVGLAFLTFQLIQPVMSDVLGNLM